MQGEEPGREGVAFVLHALKARANEKVLKGLEYQRLGLRASDGVMQTSKLLVLKADIKPVDIYYCVGDYGAWLVGRVGTSLSAFIFGKF